MKKTFRRVLGQGIGFSLLACALLQTSCSRPAPPEPFFSVGIADSAELEGKTLTLHRLRLVSDGFFVSKSTPPETELKGKVLLQVAGLKRATQVSVQLGTGLKLAGAPHDSPEAKAFRERYFSLLADEYDLTQYSADGKPSNIPTEDIDLIVLEDQ
ncbi:MAG TPA: hypothetical protein VHY91_23810 [Pirellulales bacterium]|nr:hypothetical protein [Pirellulales bacterium]